MTISRDGIVYVADRNANRVQAFTLDGKFLKEGWVSRVIAAGRFRHRFRRGLSGDKAQRFLYVADGHNERVQVLDRGDPAADSGARKFGHLGPYPGQFFNIHVMASDAQGQPVCGLRAAGGCRNSIS